jgi:phage tail sheath protein FI
MREYLHPGVYIEEIERHVRSKASRPVTAAFLGEAERGAITTRLVLRDQWRLGALFGCTEQEAFSSPATAPP